MKKKVGIALVGIVVIAVAAFVFLMPKKAEAPNEEVVQLEATSTPNYTIEIDNGSELLKLAPSLTRGITFGETVPEAVRASIQKRYDEATQKLKNDPLRADEWFNLGIFYHAANDYKGAEEVWLFLVKAVPDSAVPLDNLGKLYKFNLKDFPKSESYFKQSIVVNSDSTTPYFELFELYRYLYKTNTTAAIDIITEAQKKFPTNPDPFVVLGTYYRDIKNYAGARAEYTKALDIARELKNVQLIDAIGQEIANLPQ